MKQTLTVLVLTLVLTSILQITSHGQTIWSEDFNDPGLEEKGMYGESANGITTNMSGVTNWTVLGAGGLDGDSSLNWWMVTNSQFEGQDVGTSTGYWKTEDIDVLTNDEVEFSMSFNSIGDGLSAGTHHFTVEYILDGGSDQEALKIEQANQALYDGMAWTSSAIDVSSATSLNVKVSAVLSSGGNGWAFDNVSVDPYVAPSNIPPVIAIDPASLDVKIAVGHQYNILVTSTEPDGNTITLGASNMPSGAVFSPNPITGASVVSNTFSWTPTSKGSENVLFYTSDDADGAGTPVIVNFTVRDASSIMITEIIPDPVAVGDTLGEWFEVYNYSRSDIDINGWTIKDDGSNSHKIDNGGALNVPAWGFLVLGKNDNTASNGNVTLDYKYSSSFILSNGDDEIVLLNAATQEMARVNYDGGPNFPDPSGASMYLKDPTLDQNTGANWAVSTNAWPGSAGDFGTPGQPNDQGDWSEVISSMIFIVK